MIQEFFRNFTNIFTTLLKAQSAFVEDSEEKNRLKGMLAALSTTLNYNIFHWSDSIVQLSEETKLMKSAHKTPWNEQEEKTRKFFMRIKNWDKQKKEKPFHNQEGDFLIKSTFFLVSRNYDFSCSLLVEEILT